jgi:hypothetical protein
MFVVIFMSIALVSYIMESDQKLYSDSVPKQRLSWDAKEMVLEGEGSKESHSVKS